MPTMPNFEAWAIFAKVAERGSFSDAAAELGLAKTTVSKAIARLEERLKTTLLHRTTRRLTLTETGRMSLSRATRIMQDGLAIEEDVAEEAGTPAGTIRLAVTVAFGIFNLAPVLPAFMEAYPNIAVDLVVTDHPFDLVKEGFDLAIRIGAVADSSLLISRLFSFRVPLVAAPAYFARHGRPQHPSELEKHHALIYSHIAGAADWQFHHPTHGTCTVHVEGRLHINNGLVAVPALVAGLGLTLQPESYVWRELADGTLEEAMSDWRHKSTPVYMLTPPRRVRPARVRVFMDFLRERFRDAPWASGIEL